MALATTGTHQGSKARFLFSVFLVTLTVVTVIAWYSLSSSRTVHQQTSTLTNNRIPELLEISALEHAISERINTLYLYYATTDRELWLAHDTNLKKQISQHLINLDLLDDKQNFGQKLQLQTAQLEQKVILFDNEMRNDRNWDVLRDHLAGAQKDLNNTRHWLNQWSQNLRDAAIETSKSTLYRVDLLSKIQVFFSSAVLVIGAFVLVALYSRIKDQQKLFHQAYYDEVTSLPNRRFLEQHLAQHLQSSQSGYLVLIRLNHYRKLASTYGHSFADELMQNVSTWMSAHAKNYAGELSLYRLNTDNLALVGLDESMMRDKKIEMLENFLTDLQEKAFEVEQRTHHMTFHFGVACFPDNCPDVATIIRNADAALHNITDKKVVNFFTPKMAQSNIDWLTLETDLRHALNEKEFTLYFQPKVDSKNTKICSAEALIRWRKNGNMISPGVFIPVAEESGLIAPLGTWVLHEACRQWDAWHQTGVKTVPIAVNISAQQFQDPAFPALVAQTLKHYHVPPKMIELEITEEVAAGDPEQVIATMNTLKTIGVSIAIDDFGTGYSSLAYLQKFPIDTLKIDQSFVRKLDQTTQTSAITKLIINLAHEFHLKVVAEGVETVEQKNILNQLGCDIFQGYLFGKPMPADDFFTELRKQATPDSQHRVSKKTLSAALG